MLSFTIFHLPSSTKLLVLLPLAACGLVVFLLTRPAAVVPERYDLVIENARLADGAGGPLTSGSIAIREGRIVAVIAGSVRFKFRNRM